MRLFFYLESIMATDKVVIEAQKVESCMAAGYGDTSIQVKIVQVPAKTGPITAVQPSPTAAAATKGDPAPGPPKVVPVGRGHRPASTVPGRQTSSPSVMMIGKVAAQGGVSSNSQPQVAKPALSQVGSLNQTTTQGRTVMITVPKAAAPQSMAVAPQRPQTASPQFPANIQIPPGKLAPLHCCIPTTRVYRLGYCDIFT